MVIQDFGEKGCSGCERMKNGDEWIADFRLRIVDLWIADFRLWIVDWIKNYFSETP